MRNTKPWYKSKTILGSVTTGIIALGAVYHIPLADLSGEIFKGLLGLGAFASVAYTIYGRFKAIQTLTRK